MITAGQIGWSHDDYAPMLGAVCDHFSAMAQDRDAAGVPLGSAKVFTTDADGLWPLFLAGLPEHLRQQHNCHACRHFVERFGGLVVLDEQGRPEALMWGEAPGVYSHAFWRVRQAVVQARVTGVFVTDHKTWGTPENRADNTPDGRWRHLAVTVPKGMVHAHAVKTAHERAAELREDFGMLSRTLAEYPLDVLEEGLRIVRSESLYRGEKVADNLAWLVKLQRARGEVTGPARVNVVWRAVASAPAGWCHVRAGMVGTLLDDVKAGLPFPEIKRKFGAKMDPTQYRRPSAPLTQGTAEQAEKLVAGLGTAAAFQRRYATFEDLRPHWTPTRTPERQDCALFTPLVKPAVRESDRIELPTMTMEKFLRTVVPDAATMEVQAPLHGPYLAYTTALDPEAPPILQWDHEDKRNPVSIYVYSMGSYAEEFNLRAGAWVPVLGMTTMPWEWEPGFKGNQSAGEVFVLAGCRDLKRGSGLGLFPEFLRSDYNGVRAAVEAYSRARDPEGRDTAVAGLAMSQGSKRGNIKVRITDYSGGRYEVTLDRWD